MNSEVKVGGRKKIFRLGLVRFVAPRAGRVGRYFFHLFCKSGETLMLHSSNICITLSQSYGHFYDLNYV